MLQRATRSKLTASDCDAMVIGGGVLSRDRAGLDGLYERVARWPGVVVEFAPELSGKGPKIHFIVREPSGIRIEFAFDQRVERPHKRGLTRTSSS